MRSFTLESKPFLPLTRASTDVVAGLLLTFFRSNPAPDPKNHVRLWIIIGEAVAIRY
jgi:hypothetical protein